MIINNVTIITIKKEDKEIQNEAFKELEKQFYLIEQ